MSPWVRKHRPKNLKEIESQDEAVIAIKNFISSFKKSRKKAVMIYGPVGCGKTCSIYAVANDLGYEVLEVNASDFRNKEAINTIVGSASRQMPLFSKGKIILVDEIDGLAGRQDSGGVAALASVIDETSFPIIMTCNNPYEKNLSSLRSKSLLVEFKTMDSKSIFNVLKCIAQRENVMHDDIALKALASRSGGDLRAAINDLQQFSSDRKLTKDFVDEISQREKQESIMNALIKVMKTTDASVSAAAFDNVQEDLDEQFLWIDENLPKEYKKPEDLQRAYEFLSKADVFRGRIRRWQHWRFLLYVNSMMTAGVSVSKDERYKEFTQFGPTRRKLKIWQANMKYQKRKDIAEKIAAKNHCSKKRALTQTLPYVQVMYKSKNRQIQDSLSQYFEFDDEEIGWLKNK